MRRWLAAKGSRVALFPNLNVKDPAWRELFRKADFRRALSIAINREDINNAIFYGLATPANNTVLPQSPLYEDEFRTKWTQYDPDLANKMLDDLGLTERDGDGMRLLPDGRPMQIVVETAGEEMEQTDVLELVRDDWRKIGIGVFIKPSQREVFYNRIKAGIDADVGVAGAGERHAESLAQPRPSWRRWRPSRRNGRPGGSGRRRPGRWARSRTSSR